MSGVFHSIFSDHGSLQLTETWASRLVRMGWVLRAVKTLVRKGILLEPGTITVSLSLFSLESMPYVLAYKHLQLSLPPQEVGICRRWRSLFASSEWILQDCDDWSITRAHVGDSGPCLLTWTSYPGCSWKLSSHTTFLLLNICLRPSRVLGDLCFHDSYYHPVGTCCRARHPLGTFGSELRMVAGLSAHSPSTPQFASCVTCFLNHTVKLGFPCLVEKKCRKSTHLLIHSSIPDFFFF